MRMFLILLILLTSAASAYSATVYRWIDEKGAVSFTDEYKNVPPAFRSRVETEEYFEEAPPPAKTKGDAKTESYALSYWNKKLDEATSNYEKALQGILNEGEKLVWHRYGSKTQYQMFTADLPAIRDRLETYREQMIEAKARLDRFTKEAQEREDASRERSASSVNTDLYGRDEAWWKDRVRPWKEQLKEARQNYEEACDAFVKQVETLGPFKFGRLSLTQYQMISSRLTELTGRMAKDQAQISESRSVLLKLSKEAREAKADPVWLE